MELPRKAKIFFFISLALYIIILRYPFYIDYTEEDSYTTVYLMKAIINNGNVGWLYHPLAFFGMTPYSAPAAEYLFLSQLRLLTGANFELISYTLSILFGFMATFGIYMIVKDMKNNESLAMIAPFMYTGLLTIWVSTSFSLSIRQLYNVTMVYLVWSVLRLHNAPEIKWNYLLVFLLLTVGAFSAHRMGSFIPFLLAAYMIALFFEKHKDSESIIIKHFPATLLLGFAAILVVQFPPFSTYYKSAFSYYATGTFFNSDKPEYLFLNMLIDNAQKSAIFLLLGFYGILIMIYKHRKSHKAKNIKIEYENRLIFEEVLLIATLFAFSPVIGFGIYLPITITPYIVLLGTLGIYYLIFKKTGLKYLWYLMLVLFFTGSLMSVIYWTEIYKFPRLPPKTILFAILSPILIYPFYLLFEKRNKFSFYKKNESIIIAITVISMIIFSSSFSIMNISRLHNGFPIEKSTYEKNFHDYGISASTSSYIYTNSEYGSSYIYGADIRNLAMSSRFSPVYIGVLSIESNYIDIQSTNIVRVTLYNLRENQSLFSESFEDYSLITSEYVHLRAVKINEKLYRGLLAKYRITYIIDPSPTYPYPYYKMLDSCRIYSYITYTNSQQDVYFIGNYNN